MLANLIGGFLIIMAFAVAALCVILIVSAVGLYPDSNGTTSHLRDKPTTLNRAPRRAVEHRM